LLFFQKLSRKVYIETNSEYLPKKTPRNISIIQTNFQKIVSTVSKMFLQETTDSVKVDFDFIPRNSS